MKMKKILSKTIILMMVISFFYVPQSTLASSRFSLTITEDAFAARESVDINIQNKVKGSTYTWTSSNTKIATVDRKGIVKGLKAGDVIITCTIVTPDGKTTVLTSDITINSKKKVTVTTQEQLDKALADKNVEQIIIKTSKKKEFRIPEGKYAKRLYMKAPNSNVVNEGDFMSVHTYVANQEQLEKALNDPKVTIVSIITDNEGNFEIKGDYPSTRIIVKAPKSTLTIEGQLRGTDVQAANDIITVDEESKVKEDPLVGEVTPVVPAPSFPVVPGPSVPVPPVTPVNPNPTVPPVTPEVTPTPSVPVEEPNKDGDDQGQPSDGDNNPVITELEQAKINAKNAILTTAEAKMSRMTYSAWVQFRNGVVQEALDYIDGRTTVGSVESNLVAILNTINSIDGDLNDIPYYTNLILPISFNEYGNLVYTPDAFNVDGVENLTVVNGRYLFEFDGRQYNVDEDARYINTITVQNARETAVSGSALEINIIAWNNVTGPDKLVVLNYNFREIGDGEYEYYEQPIYEDDIYLGYTIIDNKIIFDQELIDELYAMGSGTYGFVVKAKVDFLNTNSGTVIDITIPE